ncbi:MULTISPECIES: DUF6152 family protein [Cellvibrio]|jgi:hypothetical protein|uniref:Uncharacterized protein n=1 Tax=Cellvibrio fibrivorans TaxID=126350 RepID=A0ABU1UY79_9GAMM|nr:DUF6152 family protein [Cellvibrio fibrivorans]MDR7090067.1 hypothetical protein [Cellvibrio fibrivorans]
MSLPSKKTLGFLVSLLWFLSATAATAHLAFSAEFDAQKPFELKSETTKKTWVNSPGWIYLDVRASQAVEY